MKIKDRIHLNGYPDKQGVISDIKQSPFGESYMIAWDNSRTSRNPAITLCQCIDRHCERE